MDRCNHGILAVASLPLKAVNRRLPRPSLINCEIRLSQIRQFASGFRALRAIPLNEFLGELGRKRPAVPLGISSLRFDRRGHIPEFHRRRLCLGGALPWWQRTLLCRRKATLGQEGATGNDNCHPFHLEPPPRNLAFDHS